MFGPLRPARRPAPEARRRLERLVAEIQQHTARAGREIWEIGRRVETIHRQQLYAAKGYASFAAFVEDALPFSPRHARRLIRIARHFNAAIAARYGIEKLDLMIRLMALTPADEQPGDLLAAKIRVRGKRGRYRTLSLHSATCSDIREAIALLKEARRAGHRIPARWRQRARSLERAIPAAPGGLGRGPRIRLRRGSDGKLGITFRDIPIDALEQFLAALHTLVTKDDGR